MRLPFGNKVRSVLAKISNSRANNTSNKQVRLAVEALESRELMSVTPVLSSALGTAVSVGALKASTLANIPPSPPAAGVALINSLTDANVRSAALADFSRDFGITRNDMMDIFNRGTLGYTAVTSTCIESLEKLVQPSNSATLGMPAYVQNLGYKVVWNSIAPMEDVGQQLNLTIVSQAPAGKPTAGKTTPNGAYQTNIKACAQSIEQGVFNYFEGSVLPDATYSYNGTTYTPTWQWFNTMPLFNSGGPNYQDVAQGQVDDCWLIASLAEVAVRNPTAIENMFINNGDGTFTVRFYNGTTPDFVTVDTRLPMMPSTLPVAGPTNPNGSPEYAATLYDHPLTCLWVALAEKAYAMENGNGWIGSGHKGVASYAALGDDYPSDCAGGPHRPVHQYHLASKRTGDLREWRRRRHRMVAREVCVRVHQSHCFGCCCVALLRSGERFGATLYVLQSVRCIQHYLPRFACLDVDRRRNIGCQHVLLLDLCGRRAGAGRAAGTRCNWIHRRYQASWDFRQSNSDQPVPKLAEHRRGHGLVGNRPGDAGVADDGARPQCRRLCFAGCGIHGFVE